MLEPTTISIRARSEPLTALVASVVLNLSAIRLKSEGRIANHDGYFDNIRRKTDNSSSRISYMGRDFAESSDQSIAGEDIHIGVVFDVDPTEPYDAMELIWRYLSQETRHDILQLIIGHPHHLVSITEFDYYLPRSRATISDQLNDLADHRILEKYHHRQNEGKRDLPADFWGPTEFGVRLLSEYNHLRGLPILRAIHDATQKSETAHRHETAPRPKLPEPIREVFDYREPNELDTSSSVSKALERPIYADAAPTDPSTLNKDIEDGRSLNELF